MTGDVHELFDEKLCHQLKRFLPPKLRERVQLELEHAVKLYLNDRHFEVMTCINNLINECDIVKQSYLKYNLNVDPALCLKTEINDSPSALSLELFIGFIHQSKLFKVSLEKINFCNRLINDINDKDDWQTVGNIDASGSGTYYRRDVESEAHLFKVIGDIPNSLPCVMSVLMELDLYTEWFPFCFQATMQGELTRFHKTSHLAIRVPWPFTNRDVFLEGYGVDDLTNNKRVVIVSHSLHEENPLPIGVKPPPSNSFVRLRMEYSGFIVQSLSPTQSRISFIMNVDPKLPHAPMWAVNWASGKLVWATLGEISKAAKKVRNSNSKYAERRRLRSDVYNYLDERFCEICKLHFSQFEN